MVDDYKIIKIYIKQYQIIAFFVKLSYSLSFNNIFFWLSSQLNNLFVFELNELNGF